MAAAFLLLAPYPSAAQDPDVLRQLEDLFTRGQTSYDEFELTQAQYHLEMAVRIAGTQGLSHPVMAKVHVLLGVVRFSQTRDAVSTEQEFVAAMRHDASITLDPTLASPELTAVFVRARARLRPPPASLPTTRAAPPTARPLRPELSHRPTPDAHEGVNIPVYVQVQDGGEIQRFLLRFRRPGGSWGEVDLLPQSGGAGASGYIPRSAVVGSKIQYYISALDWSGKVLARAGSEHQPFSISVVQAAVSLPPPEEEPSPVPLLPGPEVSRILHLMLLGMGTGVGIAQGPPLRRPEVEIDTGFAPTPFHIYGELGIYATHNLLLLLAARVQVIVEEDSYIFEPMPSLRGRWYFEEALPLRAFVGAGGGWCGFTEDCGYVQHQVNLMPVEDFTDTTREGNAHVGIEGGLTVDFSRYVSLQTSLFLYGLFGEKASFQADLNLGLVLTF